MAAFSRRRGKRTGLLAASVLFAAAAALLVVVQHGQTALAIPLVVVVGIGYAGMQMFPLSMLPDVIAADEASSGARRAGVFTGVWTAAETLGLAVDRDCSASCWRWPVTCLPAGTTSSSPAAPSSPCAWASPLLPAVLVLAAVPVFARYRLDPFRGDAHVSPDEVLAELRALQTGYLPTHGGAHDGLRLRLRATGPRRPRRGGAGRVPVDERPRPDGVPERRAHRERPGRCRHRAAGRRSGAVGTLTSGGTESCLLAVLSAREVAGAPAAATAPRLLLPVTAHAAFRKAAHLFDLEVVDVPVDPVTCRPDPAAVAAALDERTALVVVSAPSYPHGVARPGRRDRGAGGRARACRATSTPASAAGSCRSSTTLPEPFDLSVPGVTSLSVDLHKYGYAPEGRLDAALPRRRAPPAHWFATAGGPATRW